MEAGMDDQVIETDGLTKRYGHVLAVDGLSLNVPRGRIFGLLGPNGSGKTTLMSMLLGLVRPTAGRFTLFGSSPETGGLDRSCTASEPSSRRPLFTRTCRGETTWPTSRASQGGAILKSLTTCWIRWDWADVAATSSRPIRWV